MKYSIVLVVLMVLVVMYTIVEAVDPSAVGAMERTVVGSMLKK